MGGIFNFGRPQPRGRGRGIPAQRSGPPLLQQHQQRQLQQQPEPIPIPYNDFQLLSCARAGSKTNLIDFKDSHKNIDMAEFSRPVKLHRKDYYNRLQQQNRFNMDNNNNNNNLGGDIANDANATISSTPSGETSSPSKTDTNGPNTPNSNTGANQQQQQQQQQQQNQQQQRYDKYQQGPKTGADTSLIAPMGGATRNKQMLFKKRTKQIYLAKEDTRELKEQEHRPWILEDFNGTNSFTGTLEGGQRSDYVLFVLTENGFKVVPLDRWYKFQRKRHIRTLNADEVEEQLKKERKLAKHDSNRWMMLKRDEEDLGEGSSPPKSRFKISDNSESRRAGSDTETGGKRHDSDIDDLDFDDVFQDDEEGGNDHEMEDEDIKDGKERIKKEHKGFAPNQEDEDMEDIDEAKLTSEGKQMRKLVRDLEKNRAYESDEDKDPYATSEEELETDSDNDEEGSDKEGKDKEKQQQEASSKSTPSLKKKNVVTKPGLKKGPKKKESMSRPIGRPGSPSIKRESSPIRGLSSSPIRSGSSSPPPSSPQSDHGGGVVKKRKADDHEHRHGKQQRITSPRHTHTSPSSSSTAAAASPPSGGGQTDDSSLITEEEVVETLRGRTMSTKDFLMRFRKRIKKNERNRDIITSLLKRVARHNVTSDPSVKMLELKPELA